MSSFDTTPICEMCGERAPSGYYVTTRRTRFDPELHSNPRGAPGIRIYCDAHGLGVEDAVAFSGPGDLIGAVGRMGQDDPDTA
jgi:hypothetical protein